MNKKKLNEAIGADMTALWLFAQGYLGALTNNNERFYSDHDEWYYPDKTLKRYALNFYIYGTKHLTATAYPVDPDTNDILTDMGFELGKIRVKLYKDED
jgi:hypothetical protein